MATSKTAFLDLPLHVLQLATSNSNNLGPSVVQNCTTDTPYILQKSFIKSTFTNFESVCIKKNDRLLCSLFYQTFKKLLLFLAYKNLILMYQHSCYSYIKSVNLQSITLGCLNDVTNAQSTRGLMFQVLFFYTFYKLRALKNNYIHKITKITSESKKQRQSTVL